MTFVLPYMKHLAFETGGDANFPSFSLGLGIPTQPPPPLTLNRGAFPGMLRILEDCVIQASVYDGVFLF